MKKTYPLFKARIDVDQALINVKEVLESGFINEGLQVMQLTDGLKHVMSSENVVLVNSCTSALTMALHLAGVGAGDEVISTPMTCVATNAPIVSRGANIVWADIDPRNGMLDPQDVIRRVTDRTKAVMAVAWAGTPPGLQELRELCDLKGIKLILDAAHAFGARYKGSSVHAWSHYCCYSFQAIKHFTTGDGGALVCSDVRDHERAKALKWFGLDRDRAKDAQGNWKGQQWDVDIAEAGYKFNMNNVSAAIGLSQLPHVDETLRKHRENASLYDELFGGWNASSYITPNHRGDGTVSSHWVYAMQLGDKLGKLSRDDMLAALNAEGIMAGVVHVPNDTYTCFERFKADLPGVRQFAARQLALPCGWWLDEADIRHIAMYVKSLAQHGKLVAL